MNSSEVGAEGRHAGTITSQEQTSMTLYSTSAAAHRLATTRGTVQQLARAAGIGRGAGGSEQVAWLFTDQEIERMRAAMAQSG